MKHYKTKTDTKKTLPLTYICKMSSEVAKVATKTATKLQCQTNKHVSVFDR